MKRDVRWGRRRWTLSGRLSPCAFPCDLISFDARPLILIASPMDWVQAVGRRFVPLLLVLAMLFRFLGFVFDQLCQLRSENHGGCFQEGVHDLHRHFRG